MTTSRHTGITGGVYTSLSKLTAVSHRVDTLVRLTSGETYSIDAIDGGEGVIVAGGNYANIIESVSVPTTVIPQTVSGLMTTGGQINQLQDSGAFTLPLANSVPVNTYIVVELPETYKTQTPTLTRTGADLIENDLGTDTSITWTGAARLTLTSDGVSKWRL